jgi:hypothetical protein
MFRHARMGPPGLKVGRADWARQDRFRRGRPVAKRATWPRGVVVAAPPLDQHRGLPERD